MCNFCESCPVLCSYKTIFIVASNTSYFSNWFLKQVLAHHVLPLSFLIVISCRSAKDEKEHCLQTEEIIKSNPAPANVSLLASGKSHNQEVAQVA